MATESDRKAATNDSLGNQVVINLYCASVSYFDHKLNACIYWSFISSYPFIFATNQFDCQRICNSRQ